VYIVSLRYTQTQYKGFRSTQGRHFVYITNPNSKSILNPKKLILTEVIL